MSTKTYAADDYAEIGRRMRELSEQQTKSVVNKPYECRVCSNSGWLGNSECDICGNPMGLAQPGNDGGDFYADLYSGWKDAYCYTCENGGWVFSSYQAHGAPNLDPCPDCQNSKTNPCP